MNLVAFIFLNEEGEFLGAENFPLPLFNHPRAGVACPGELTCIFFWEEIITASHGSTLSYSNPLRVDQASNIYFKDTTAITTGNLKNTRLPPSGAFRLSRAGQGTAIYQS